MLRFPTCFPSFRVVGEKQLPQEIIFLVWSPKRDLIALANTAGEVLLHRLASFHRVWSFPPNENTGKEVTCLAWRPDGKLLAFALADTKKIVLCDVEKPESLHSFSVEAPVSCMHWMEVTVESSVLTSFYNAEDESNLLLPKLPTLPKKLNILVLGGSSGFIELYAYGMFKIARVTGEKNTTTSVQDEFMHLLLWGKASAELQTLLMNQLTVKMTQKDITFVAEFLTEHFNEAPDLYNRKGKYFNVEKVGQYLKDEDDDLVSPPNTEGNQWYDFLQNSSHLKESPLLFPYYPRKSLHFVKRRMENIIDQCLQKPADVIGKSMNQAICIPLYRDARRSVSNGLIAIKFGSFTYATTEKVRRSTYSCLDAQFYDDETVTVVLKDTVGREGRDRLLVQLPLSLVYNCEDSADYQFTGTYSTRLDEQCAAIPTRTMHFEKHWRLLESMKAQYVAGNGFRKVSCVLSSNLRHVRVFEMDIDDEWELDESSDEEEEGSNKPVKIKEEVLSESEAENQPAGAALAPEIVIKVEKLDPELDS
ncbi:Anaphase-promoting complex subunit 4 [Pteropus alecto]|uniref:Anaphase-promoting complex subunit 4 n=1 Tax=Pteropus alecto TaxID=9402 RepID=L5K7J3_PTEAL|nr:Anaphase-promoting complex subunit 4 [Pteropus alecto]